MVGLDVNFIDDEFSYNTDNDNDKRISEIQDIISSPDVKVETAFEVDDMVRHLKESGINVVNFGERRDYSEEQDVSHMTEGQKIDRLSKLSKEKISKAAEIFRNLNLKYDLTEKSIDKNFWNRTSSLISGVSKLPAYHYEMDKFMADRKARVYAFEQVIHGESAADQVRRKAAEEQARENFRLKLEKEKQKIINDEFTNLYLWKRAKGSKTTKEQRIKELEEYYASIEESVVKLDTEEIMDAEAYSDNAMTREAFGDEFFRATQIKKAYEFVMEHGSEIDKEQAGFMFDIYCSVYDASKEVDLESVKIVPVRESEYCEAAKGYKKLTENYELKIPESWVTVRENSKTGEAFDVIKFPADFQSGKLDNKYTFSLSEGTSYKGVENGKRIYQLPTFSQVALRKVIGKDSSGKWQYDWIKTNPVVLGEIIDKYNTEKEKVAEQEKVQEEEQADYGSYGFTR